MVDLVLMEADSGRTVEVAPDTAVHLRLPENPTTGYRWVMTMTPPDCVRIGGDRFLRPSGAAIGAGGLRVVDITMVTESPCALAMAYRRPWETDAPAASELHYRFVTPP